MTIKGKTILFFLDVTSAFCFYIQINLHIRISCMNMLPTFYTNDVILGVIQKFAFCLTKKYSSVLLKLVFVELSHF